MTIAGHGGTFSPTQLGAIGVADEVRGRKALRVLVAVALRLEPPDDDGGEWGVPHELATALGLAPDPLSKPDTGVQHNRSARKHRANARALADTTTN